MSHLRLQALTTLMRKLGGFLVAAIIFALLCASAPPTLAHADESTHSARVVYHFVEPAQLEAQTAFSDYEDSTISFCSGAIERTDSEVIIHANAYPRLISVSPGEYTFRVIKDYASTSEAGTGPQDITAEATYHAEDGTVSLPASYADADLTVAWYVSAESQTIEIPLEVTIAKTIEGVSSNATLTHPFAADTQIINLKLFDDEDRAARVKNIHIIQGGEELTQYVYQNGSISLVASPLSGPIEISLDDETESCATADDTECAVNSDRPIFSLFSAANPVVGERFTLDYNCALIRTCESGGNMAQACGWPEKSHTYGFAVHFNHCVNPEVVNADQNHIAPGGTVHTPGGGTYDYNWISGMHFAWGDCAGNIDNNGTGEPEVTSGWVEVTNVDYNTQTVSYRYHLNVHSDIDGHTMQSIVGTFQVHEDLIGYLEVKKQSALPDISTDNGCYSLEGARYGIYRDAECTELEQTLITDTQGCARSKALLVGSYYVKELSAPTGYALDDEVHEVTIAAGTTRTCTVEDTPQSHPQPLLLSKHDSDYPTADDHNSIQGGATSFKGAEFTVTFYPTLDDNYAATKPLRTWVFAADEHGFINLSAGDSCKVSGDEFFHDSNGATTLPIGTYAIRETKAPYGYNLNDTTIVRTVTGTQNGEETLSSYSTPIISDAIIRGGIELEKRDAESGLQSALGAATLDGTTFTITNENSHDVQVGGIFYKPGEVCATLIAYDGKATTTTSALPFGDYSLREVSAGDGYNVSESSARSFSIEREGQVVKFTDPDKDTPSHAFRDQVKRGDLNFVKVRESNEQRLAGVPFKITSQTTGESHVIVSDENGVVNTAANWVKHTARTNGNDEDPSHPEWGVWFGMTKDGFSTDPRDDLGALPFDTYTLEELRCTANEGLELVTTTFSIYREQQALDFGVIQNHAPDEPWLVTRATDGNDYDKLLNAQSEAVVNDHIQYGNLKPGETYTLKGELADKKTGAVLEGAAGTTTFVATTSAGTTDVRIPVDLSAHSLDDLVVYETLLLDDQVLLEHNDINNTEQTVAVANPRIATSAIDAADGDHDVLNDTDALVVDAVSFTNLVVGKEYTVIGTLMKKEAAEGEDASGVPLTDANGNEITESVTFTPQVSDGSVEVKFALDASVLEAGAELVVFERLTSGNEDVAAHADINDEHQTITIVTPNEPLTPTTLDAPEPENTEPAGKASPSFFAKTGAAIVPWIIGALIFMGSAAIFLIIALFKHRKAQEITAAIAYNMLGDGSRWRS